MTDAEMDERIILLQRALVRGYIEASGSWDVADFIRGIKLATSLSYANTLLLLLLAFHLGPYGKYMDGWPFAICLFLALILAKLALRYWEARDKKRLAEIDRH